jgi:hypothetical protein
VHLQGRLRKTGQHRREGRQQALEVQATACLLSTGCKKHHLRVSHGMMAGVHGLQGHSRRGRRVLRPAAVLQAEGKTHRGASVAAAGGAAVRGRLGD